ncbi:MAG: septum formation initiator family protein [Dehalococcoidia bacterium]|nr:septum formation initiator family protein [Dehalococcoidia bacterium]MCA9853080.1 septum formation initiator family protein [Dehalococcoidia bacterium]
MPRISKSPSRLLFAIGLLIGVYFASTAVQGAIRNARLEDARDQAQEEVDGLRDKKAHLTAIVEYAGSDEYVEDAARRELGFIRPGETAFVLVGPEAPEEETQSPDWWERLFPR